MDLPPSKQDGHIINFELSPENPNGHQHRLSTKGEEALLPSLNDIAGLKEDVIDAGIAPEVPTHAAVSERIKSLTVMVDDRLQNEGAALFNQFNKRIIQVEEQLLAFPDAVRSLGPSVGFVPSSYNLQARLQQILHLFRENASEIFPTKIKKEPAEPLQPFSSRQKRAGFRKSAVQPRLAHLTSDLDEFPLQFELLAGDMATFLQLLHDIPEFRDDGLNVCLLSFEGDLKYWASCLREFEGQFRFPAVSRYINDLTREMDEHLESILDALVFFAEQGVESTRIAQVDAQNGLLSLSAVATFFSGIAATTIQYIIDKVDTRLQQVVVTLWIASILFGAGSAVNSQLSYQWRASAHRSPRSAIPVFFSFALTRSTPLIFLALSIMAFSAGLLCYAYSSFQGTLVTTCTTVFACMAFLAPFSVAVWLGAERLAFAQSKGSKTPKDIMSEWRRRFLSRIGWIAEASRSAGLVAKSNEILAKLRDLIARARRGSSSTARRGSSSTGSAPYDMEECAIPPPLTLPTPRMRFRDAVRRVTHLERWRPTPKSPTKIGPWPGHARGRSLTLPVRSSNGYTDPNERFALRQTRLAGLIQKLKALKPTQELYEHAGLVRHLQFSPDGKWLATCSWDRKAIIWKVEATLSLHGVLAHAGTGFLSQVAWSPDGKFLLTRTFRHVKVWAADTGVLKQTISCKSKIEAVTWMPTGDSFACVEGNVVHIMDLGGKIKDDHPFDRLEIHDVAPTYDEQRMILVATLQSSKGDLKPSKSRAEKRIIVYHLGNKKVECQVPVLENVRDVTISSDRNNGDLALISYEDTAPPELWRMSVVHTEDREEARLQLLQTYMPTVAVEFAGPSYLGGIQDEFVICAGKKGDIYIWARETGLLLHTLQGANIVDNTPKDLTSVAWSHRETGRYMFASATNDGTVRIWTAQAPSDSQQPGPSRTGRSPPLATV